MTRLNRGGIFTAMGMTMRESFHVWVAAAVVVALLSGCNKAEEAAVASTAKADSGSKNVNARAIRSDMVSAVSGGKAGPPVTLKFALNQRPLVGEPIDVEVALIPVSPLDRLFVRFQPSSGLTLVKGGESPEYENPPTGQPIAHVVTVMANNDGIFYITAAVVADAPDLSLTRTFSIPVIAGNGISAPAPKPTAQAADAPAAR
jgi:hypothetical protein